MLGKYLNPEYLISSFGYAGLFAIVFAESGLMIGFFLPGDSLLVTAGLIASRNLFGIHILPLIIVATIGAILGDSVGYWFGRKTGPRIFKRENSLLFHKDNLVKARKFYDRHGPITIVIARFMPFIRTFAPIVAGVGDMSYPVFISFNVIGGVLWVLAMTLLGFFLGTSIPNVDKYIHWIILAIVLVSVSPPLYHFWKAKRKEIVFWAERLLRLKQ